MVEMKRLYAIIAVAALFSSCVKEVVEPGMRISGTYTYDDGTGLNKQYLSFENGYYSEVSLTQTLSYMEDSYWGYNNSYERVKKNPYSIQDGHLLVAGQPRGTVEIKDDFLYFQGKKYSKVKGFNKELYSSIVLPEGMTKTVAYEFKEYSVPVTINRPIPAGVLIATSSTAWISEVKVQDGRLTFKASETKSDRVGTIILRYTNANSVTLTVAQRPSTFIKWAVNERTVGYTQSSQSLAYTIENPLPGSALEISCTAYWVKNIVIGADAITFDVNENPGTTSRTATLTGSYSGAADVVFTLTQSGAVTTIVTTPTSQSCTYTGGDFSFDFSIENPRQGISLSAATLPSWITDVTISGNTVSYKVAENNSGSARNGKIKLSYGAFATKEFIVFQSWSASAIATTPPSQEVTYTGGDFSFDFSIENPRQGANMTATSLSSWITDVSISGNKVSYKVAENNSGSSRTGKIKLSYGTLASKEFSVSQSWSAAAITTTPISQDVSYAGGSFSLDFSVSNPREGVVVTAASQSDWITDVSLSGNKVSYKVAENNSSAQRSANITLSYGSFATKSFSITQTGKPVQSITLNKSSLELYAGTSETLTATVNPSDAALSWSSLDKSIATVSSSGVVTGVARGTASITVSATDGSGKSATCMVEVKQYVTGITLNKTSLTLNEGQTETLSATVTPDNANDKTVTWSSDDTSIATVDQTGHVTILSKGTTTITTTANDGSGVNATCLVSTPVELSSSGSANSYLVSSAGGYKFMTMKGNSSTSVGNVAFAEVLWESFGTEKAPSKGDIIRSVSYSGNNYIFFTTPSTLKNGNAVIAAKDASGNILWSWHIWVCEGYDPAATAQTYYNNAGVMMDRNLGATSTTPRDAGAQGLLYQWGRKDPFLGSGNILSDGVAASTLSWPSNAYSNTSDGTIAYAVAHPTTFIKNNSSNYDWYYTGGKSTDNTRWQTSKTIYDPCPPGWKVPSGGSSGVWSKAVGSSSSFSYTWANYGMNLSGKFGSASTIWYPATGYIDGIYGVSTSGATWGGFWWSCTPDGSSAYYLYLSGSGNVGPSSSGYRAYGRSVRCLQE